MTANQDILAAMKASQSIREGPHPVPPHWTLDAGRTLVRDDVPVAYLARQDDGRIGHFAIASWEADEPAQRIVELLNADEPEGKVPRRPFRNANEGRIE